MPGVLTLYNVPNPPTTTTDAIALDVGVVALNERISYIKSQATTIGGFLGGGFAEALTGTTYNLSTNSPVIQDFIPYIPPGYTVGDITLGTILNVTEGVRDDFQNQATQLRLGNIIPQDGIDDTDDDTDDEIIPPPIDTPPIPDEVDDDTDDEIIPPPIDTPPIPDEVDDDLEDVTTPPPISVPPIVTPDNNAPPRIVPDRSGQANSESSFVRAREDLKTGIVDALTGRVYLRDYTHAAKTFLPNAQGNSGKVKFTFHTVFDINEGAIVANPTTGNNLGLLVKSVKLPTFNIEVQEMNQYNRKRLIQSKIKYQPIDITFHDDNASQVTAIWDAYYRYNYADAWNPVVNPWQGASKGSPGAFNRRNIYDPSISGDTEYGYRGDVRGDIGDARTQSGEKVPFFNNITIYGMWAGTYIAYTLINPVITTFDHDTYDYADGAGTMQNRMTIDYETVIYNTGEQTDDMPPAFGKDSANYDKTKSPLDQGGNNPADIAKLWQRFNDGDISFADLQALLRRGTEGLDGPLDTGRRMLQEGARAAALAALGLGGDTNFPTNASTPAVVNIANQGVVTGATTNTTAASNTDPQTAGQQIKGFIAGALGLG